jgi:hypothetical protein
MAKDNSASGKDPDQVASLRSLANVAGRSPTSVRKWIKRSDWPFGKGPFSVRLVRQWMEIHLKRDPAQRYHDAQRGIGPKELNELDQARKEGYQEASAIRRLKRLQIEGTLHDVAECKERRRRQLFYVRNALLRFPRSVAADLVARPRGEVEAVLKRRVDAILQSFARGGEDE